jgi:hypothetical protein
LCPEVVQQLKDKELVHAKQTFAHEVLDVLLLEAHFADVFHEVGLEFSEVDICVVFFLFFL